MRILLLSDTHGCWDEWMEAHMRASDQVWHGGDLGTGWLDRFHERLPDKSLLAVYGNIDDASTRVQVPEVLCSESAGARVLMRHIAGVPRRYNAETRALLAMHKPAIFVCGHSHILRVEHDPAFGHLHLNPGAAGWHGFHTKRTLLRFELHGGQPRNMVVVEMPRTSARQ